MVIKSQTIIDCGTNLIWICILVFIGCTLINMDSAPAIEYLQEVSLHIPIAIVYTIVLIGFILLSTPIFNLACFILIIILLINAFARMNS